jgi:sporulation protein YunB
LINLQKDSNGNITFIEANTILINEIITQIVRNIQIELDKIPRVKVAINMGTVSGISMLKNIDPKFQVELESAGNINSSVRTEFKSVGINQTHHKIYLKIDSTIGILTPIATFNKKIDTEVLLTEAVIVGEVPQTYYNLNGVDEVDDMYNFTK